MIAHPLPVTTEHSHPSKTRRAGPDLTEALSLLDWEVEAVRQPHSG